MKKGSVNYEKEISSLFENLKDSVNKGLANHPIIPDFSGDQCQKPFFNKKKIYFLTAPAIAPPRKAMIARYNVITIYRKNPVPTAGM
jgi:hypothetical protein